MQFEPLNCNSCGGPLEVPETANYVTCNHCSSQLAIKRTVSATYTEQLSAIKDNQEELLEKLNRLESENRVARIDREWESEKQRYMIKDKHGNRHEPTEASVILLVLFAGFGVAWTIWTMSTSIGPPTPPAFSTFSVLIGISFTCFLLFMAFNVRQKTRDFRSARKRYRQRRSEASGSYSSDTEWSHLDHVPTPKEYLEKMEGGQS